MSKSDNNKPLTQTEDHYDETADTLGDIYDGLNPEKVHAAFLPYIKHATGWTVLDVGAHTGRDAAWLSKMGMDVTAVEPSQKCLDRAEKTCRGCAVHLIRDALPDLKKLNGKENSYDLILLSAIWMHVPPAQRKKAMNRLKELLAPGGRILISLRHGTPDAARKMYEVSQEEIQRLAGPTYGATSPRDPNVTDEQGRGDVWWSYMVVTDPRKPVPKTTPHHPGKNGNKPK